MNKPATYRIQNASAMEALGWGKSGQNQRREKINGQTMVKSIALGKVYIPHPGVSASEGEDPPACVSGKYRHFHP